MQGLDSHRGTSAEWRSLEVLHCTPPPTNSTRGNDERLASPRLGQLFRHHAPPRHKQPCVRAAGSCPAACAAPWRGAPSEHQRGSRGRGAAGEQPVGAVATACVRPQHGGPQRADAAVLLVEQGVSSMLSSDRCLLLSRHRCSPLALCWSLTCVCVVCRVADASLLCTGDDRHVRRVLACGSRRANSRGRRVGDGVAARRRSVTCSCVALRRWCVLIVCRRGHLQLWSARPHCAAGRHTSRRCPW
jgi:hypothetical protein